jgi:hypothetical protein
MILRLFLRRCDADPAALAKYVLALIKKDKSEEELHKIMVGQLEVFLENGLYKHSWFAMV